MRNNLFLTAILVLFCGSAFAGSYQNNIRSTEDRDKSVFRIKKSTGAVERLSEIQLPLQTAYLATGTAAVITFSSTPGLESEGLQESLVLDWADGEVNNVAFSMRVPVDYTQGGSIYLEALSELGTTMTTTTKISIGGRVNGGTISATDSAVTAGTFEDVSQALGLTLVAGDDLTILIVRNDTTSGTGTLQIKNVVFRYNDSIDFAY